MEIPKAKSQSVSMSYPGPAKAAVPAIRDNRVEREMQKKTENKKAINLPYICLLLLLLLLLLLMQCINFAGVQIISCTK